MGQLCTRLVVKSYKEWEEMVDGRGRGGVTAALLCVAVITIFVLAQNGDHSYFRLVRMLCWIHVCVSVYPTCHQLQTCIQLKTTSQALRDCTGSWTTLGRCGTEMYPNVLCFVPHILCSTGHTSECPYDGQCSTVPQMQHAFCHVFDLE